MNKKHLKEIKDMFDALDTNHTGYVSFKLMMDTFGGNGLFKEDELVEAMHAACGSQSMRTKAHTHTHTHTHTHIHTHAYIYMYIHTRVEAMHAACGKKSLRTKAKKKISNVRDLDLYPIHQYSLCILTFE